MNRAVILMLVAFLVTAGNVHAERTIAANFDTELSRAAGIERNDGFDFGDVTNYYTGETSFFVQGPTLIGNNALPVGRPRVFQAFDDGRDFLFRWVARGPYLSGTYSRDTGWIIDTDVEADQTKRCSRPNASGGPPIVQSTAGKAGSWDPHEYWKGITLHMDGGSTKLNGIWTALPNMPSTGGPYKWATNSGWFFSCTTLPSGGEGFVGVNPKGERYYFDAIAELPLLPQLKKINYLGDTRLDTREVRIYATRQEDRFGNWVEGSISSDGRAITAVQESATRTVYSSGNRSWVYDSVGENLTITYPDSTVWKLEVANGITRNDRSYQACNGSISLGARYSGTATVTITLRSGAKGVFTFAPVNRGFSDTTYQCVDDFYNGPRLLTQNLIQGIGLISKVVSGPNMPTVTTTIDYGPANNCFLRSPSNACTSNSLRTRTVTVSQTSGKFSRYTFGNRAEVDDGLLLTLEVGAGPADILRTETYKYQQFDPVGAPTGLTDGVPQHWAHYRSAEKERIVTLKGGDTFSRRVLQFDSFARPKVIRRWSSTGTDRTENHTYHDNLSKWILGQPSSVACAASVPADAACDGDLMSQTTYETVFALPQKTYTFGKLQAMLGYDTLSSIGSGQRGTLQTVSDGRDSVNFDTTVTFGSWKRGIPQRVSFPATLDHPSVSKSAAVNDDGDISSIDDENGFRTCYAYDGAGRLTQVTYPSEGVGEVCNDSDWNATFRTFSFVPGVYGLNSHWRLLEQTGSGYKLTHYDGLWRPVIEENYVNGDAANTRSITVKRYDAGGRLVFQSLPIRTLENWGDPALPGTRTTYDALDRVTSINQDSELGVLTTTLEYLAGFKVRIRNPRAFATTTSYQAWDEPTTDHPISIAREGGIYTDIVRDVFGKPETITRRDATSSLLTRAYTYNTHQELCRQVEPETGATLMGYDAAGNVAWSASGLPQTVTCATDPNVNPIVARKAVRTYDARNRLLTLTFPDGLGDQAWTYTPDGLPATITAYNNYNHLPNRLGVITAYVYNARRMLAGQGETVHQENWYTWGYGYGYDRNGHLAANTYPFDLSVTYAPNGLGQPTRVGSFATNVTYHPNGAVAQFTYGNGIVHVLEQNNRGLPHRIRDAKPGIPDVLDDFHAYDQNGNVIALTDGASGRAQRGNRDMTYDGLDRLKTVHWPTQTASASYTYDALDNLIRVNVQSLSTTTNRDHHYCYDGSNRLTNIKSGGCTTGSTVSGLGYDLQGNVQNKDGTQYAFDYGNRLRHVYAPGGALLESYRYDGLGRRVQTHRPSDNAKVLSQYSRDGKLVYHYDQRANERIDYLYLGNRLVAKRTRPIGGAAVYTTEYQHTDALGTPVVATDAAGNRLRYDEYEPYGLRTNRPNDNRPGHTGHVMDEPTGLTYMQQRYYDPAIGMFLSVDPVTAYSNPVGQFHRYRYANNNPYKFTDPDGRLAWLAVPAAYCALRPACRAAVYAAGALVAAKITQTASELIQQNESGESNSEGGAAPSDGNKSSGDAALERITGGNPPDRTTGTGMDHYGDSPTGETADEVMGDIGSMDGASSNSTIGPRGPVDVVTLPDGTKVIDRNSTTGPRTIEVQQDGKKTEVRYPNSELKR